VIREGIVRLVRARREAGISPWEVAARGSQWDARIVCGSLPVTEREREAGGDAENVVACAREPLVLDTDPLGAPTVRTTVLSPRPRQV